MDTATQIQILNKTVCTNALGKRYEFNYSPSSYEGQTNLFNFDMANDLGEGKLGIQTC